MYVYAFVDVLMNSWIHHQNKHIMCIPVWSLHGVGVCMTDGCYSNISHILCSVYALWYLEESALEFDGSNDSCCQGGGIEWEETIICETKARSVSKDWCMSFACDYIFH